MQSSPEEPLITNANGEYKAELQTTKDSIISLQANL